MEKEDLEITDEVIDNLCSFEFEPSHYHGKEIRMQIKEYVDKHGKIVKIVPTRIRKIKDKFTEIGSLTLNLEGNKSIIGYKHNSEMGCGCSSSYVALYDKRKGKVIKKEMFTDYFCVAL